MTEGPIISSSLWARYQMDRYIIKDLGNTSFGRACSELVSITVRLAAAAAASNLIWPAMTERIKISPRTRRKPSRKSEERVRKHTGTRESWLHSSTQGWHYVACVGAQCGFQATKSSSEARPRMEWKLAFDRALGSGFRACEAE